MKNTLPKYFQKKRAVVSGAVICALVIALLSYRYNENQKNEIRQEKQSDLKAVAELKVGELVQWKNERYSNALTIFNSPLFKKNIAKINEGSNDSLFKNELYIILKNFQIVSYENLFIISNEGKMLLSVFPNPCSNDSITSIFLSEARKNKNILFTDFYFCKSDNKIHYDIIVPIVNASSEVLASVVLRVDLDKYLYPLIKTWPYSSKSSETLIARRIADSVCALNELKFLPNSALRYKSHISDSTRPAVCAALGYTGFFESRDYRGVEVLSYVCKVPGTDWVMVAKVDRDEIFKDLYFRQSIFIIFICFVVLVLGTLAALVILARDKNTYRLLNQANEEFRITLYSIGDAVITTDTAGKIRRMNNIAEKLTGWDEIEVRGKLLSDIFKIYNENTGEKVENPVEKVLREGKVVGLANHTVIISKNGEETPIADSGAPIKNENGEISGVVLVFRDQIEERKAEQKIKASEEKYINLYTLLRLMCDNTPGMLWAKDLERNFVFTNKAVCEQYLFAVDTNEPIGKKEDFFTEREKFLHKEDSDWQSLYHLCGDSDYEIINSLKTLKYEITGNIRGKYVCFDIIKAPMFNDQGEIIGIVGSARDTTEKRIAENALKASESRYSLIMDVVNDGIWDWDVKHGTAFASANCYKIIGYPIGEFNFAKDWLSLAKKEEESLLERSLDKSVKEGDSINVEFQCRKKNGEWIWVNLRGSTVERDTNAMALRIVGTASDITNRKNDEIIKTIQYNIAEAVIKASKLKDLMEVVGGEIAKLIGIPNCFIAFYDHETNMLFSPYSIDEKDEYPLSWSAERSITGRIVQQNMALMLSKSDIIKLVENNEIDLTGSIPEILLGAPLRDNEKVIGAIVVQSYDESHYSALLSIEMLEVISRELSIFIAKQKAEEELVVAKDRAEESDLLKTAFLANMSHEIRTPMNAIIGFSQLLDDDTISDDERKDYIAIIHKKGGDLLALINDILDLSKLESKQLKLYYSDDIINPLFYELYSTFTTIISSVHNDLYTSKNIELRIGENLSDNVVFYADFSRIKQILTNLIGNAIKFTSDGYVEFGCRMQDSETLLFYVKDTGIGIHEDKLQVIFERFQQEENNYQTRSYGGTGLGLSIVHGLVELMGGRIWVESEFGKGSQFYFTLPFTTSAGK